MEDSPNSASGSESRGVKGPTDSGSSVDEPCRRTDSELGPITIVIVFSPFIRCNANKNCAMKSDNLILYAETTSNLKLRNCASSRDKVTAVERKAEPL